MSHRGCSCAAVAVVLVALFGCFLCLLCGPVREKARASHGAFSASSGEGAAGGMEPGPGAMPEPGAIDAPQGADAALPQSMDASADEPEGTSVADHADRTGRRVDDLKKYLATPEGQRRVKHLRAQH